MGHFMAEKDEKIKAKQREKTKKYNRKHSRKPPRRNKKDQLMQSMASERIEYLMNRALEIYAQNPDYANKYATLAKKYAMSAKVKIPPHYRKLFCHKCKKLMIPGISRRTRIQSQSKRGSRLVITCLNCGHMIHIYFKSKNQTQNQEITEKK